MGLVDEAVQRFPNVARLSKYSKKYGKIFPKSEATGSLTLMLRHVRNPELDDARKKGSDEKRQEGKTAIHVRRRKAKEKQEAKENGGGGKSRSARGETECGIAKTR